MGGFKVISSGLMTTVQDMGRKGYRQFGVPVSGAMDSRSLMYANLLVGNDADAAALEMTLNGVKIEFEDATCVAVTGGVCEVTLNDVLMPLYETIFIQRGDQLEIGVISEGLRCYLAISGGIAVPEVMGSLSTYMRGGFGGLEGRKLKPGDWLQTGICDIEGFKRRTLPPSLRFKYASNAEIRVVLGPEVETFTERGVETFLGCLYTLSSQCDRMGYRLLGEKVEHQSSADIISNGIVPGAIQVPGSGEPIIMMADAQTTGGYTKIASVISLDLPLLAQMRPGDRIRFKQVSIEEAQTLLCTFQKNFDALKVAFAIAEMGNSIENSSNGHSNKEQSQNTIRQFIVSVDGKPYEVTVSERHN